MQVRVWLRSLLEEYLPLAVAGDNMVVDVVPGASVEELVAGLGVPSHRVHLVIRNGRFVPREQRQSTVLAEGDSVELWPLVAGG